MRPADAHLTPQEMEQLLLGADGSNHANDGVASAAQQHLSRCAACQSVAEKYSKANLRLGDLGKANGESRLSIRGTECPADGVWIRLAAKLMDDKEASGHVSHAATCDWCGPLLKEAMEDLTQDVTPQEQEALDRLTVSSPDWQRNMANKLAVMTNAPDNTKEIQTESPEKKLHGRDKFQQRDTQKPEEQEFAKKKPAKEQKRTSSWWPKLAWATASLAVAVGSWTTWLMTREPDVNQLLAQAYTEQRTIELRVPGAAHGPIRVQRGDSHWEIPKQFHQAEIIIGEHLSKSPEDVTWLQAQARADLLQWHHANANHLLDEALNVRPDDPELLLDKAIALYEDAQKSSASPEFDYSHAIDNLSKVLQVHPDYAVALFNRAIIYEESSLYEDAISDWEHYLRIDSVGLWADEAREHLLRLKKKVQIHQDSLKQLLAPPETFIALAQDSAGVAKLDQRIEEYQDSAITRWIVEAYFPNQSPKLRTDAAGALHELGKILATRHGDHWLNDLISNAGSQAFLEGLISLHAAHLESAGSNWEDASRNATLAIKNFTIAKSIPGRVRAETELIYALQRSQQANECLAVVQKIKSELAPRVYPWINGQVDIDQAGCSLKMGNFDEARSASSRAIERSLRDGFSLSKMRGIGMACSVETLAGKYIMAWALCHKGLDGYWHQAEASSVAVHSCYDLLAQMSENMHWFNVALNFAQHSVLTASGRPNIQVLTRQHMAKIALKAGMPSVARGALKEASDLMESPAAKAMPIGNRVYGEVMLADIEVGLGMLSQAEERLKSLHPSASMALPITRSLYRSKGELLALQKRDNEAEVELLHAIEVIEKANSTGQAITDPAGRQAWNEENAEIYRSLVLVEMEKGDHEKAFAVLEWYRSAESNREKGASSLDEFLSQNGLQHLVTQLSGQTVLSYFLAPHGLEIWVADQQGVRSHFTSLNSMDLMKQVSSFSTMCADRDSDLMLLKARGRQLFNIFIAPIATQLAVDRPIIIENDDWIGDLPIQAFVAPDGHYLSEKYTIIFSPGLLYLPNLRMATRLSALSNAVIVASTANTLDEDTSLQPDTDAIPEGTEIAGRFSHSVFLKHTDVTRKKIRAALGQQEVLHFVSHAFSSVSNEGLLVYESRDGQVGTLWGAADVDPALFKKSQLVVLSACSTGRTLQTRRESHGQIVRSLLRAGVPGVVASRWDVESRATRKLEGFLYDSILAGQLVPSSLRQAELKLINDPATNHPYYWAAFVVFGRT